MKHSRAVFGLLLASHCTLALAAQERPNVLLIYGDDVGYGDVSAYGSQLIQTPNIDRLASQGLRFTDGHCSAATCTPSRFSLLTGIHGFRHGIRILAPNAPLSIPLDTLTLPGLFKKAGYQTAIIGKWHLGLGTPGEPVDWNAEVRPGPLELGFDHCFLLPSTNDRVPCVYLNNHRVHNLDPADPLFVGSKPEGVECTIYPDGRTSPEAMTYYRSTHGHDHSVINGIGRIGSMYGGSHALWDDETMADEFVARAKQWLAKRNPNKPFFLLYSAQDIHVPRAPHPRFRGKTGLGHRGDAMLAFDWAVGELLASLEQLELTKNTLVLFSSDNGPVYDDGYADGTQVHTSQKEIDQGHDGSGPFRGGKYQIYEGGTRVPFILRWPGKIKAGVSNAMVSQIDLLSSFAALLEIPLSPRDAIDSRNTLQAFMGHDEIGLPFMLEEANGLALRKGSWKLVSKGMNVEKPQLELYDLAADIGEERDLSAVRSKVLIEMQSLLQRLRNAERGIRQIQWPIETNTNEAN